MIPSGNVPAFLNKTQYLLIRPLKGMDYRPFCDSLTPDDIYERELFTSVQALILSVKVLPLI